MPKQQQLEICRGTHPGSFSNLNFYPLPPRKERFLPARLPGLTADAGTPPWSGDAQPGWPGQQRLALAKSICVMVVPAIQLQSVTVPNCLTDLLQVAALLL